MRTFVAMAVSYQWSPDWWRRVTWPEFKVMVLMRNEWDEAEARRAEEEDSPIGEARRDRRIGVPPSNSELAVLPRGV